mmetsp:Transcript_5336/g.9446  ORF Transcript_5336/g.9446 Transcript_5336/m.9446 type:complete len:123 (+) Transcript_5336:90-458(+)
MARSVSAVPQFGTVPITSPVAGFVTSMVTPLSAPIHEPSTKAASFIHAFQSAICFSFFVRGAAMCTRGKFLGAGSHRQGDIQHPAGEPPFVIVPSKDAQHAAFRTLDLRPCHDQRLGPCPQV